MCNTHLWEPSLNKGPYIWSRLKTGFDRWPFSQISSRSYLVGPFGWVLGWSGLPWAFLQLHAAPISPAYNCRYHHKYQDQSLQNYDWEERQCILLIQHFCEWTFYQCNGNNMYIILECHIAGWKRYQYQPLCFAITCASLPQSHGLCWIHHPNWEMYFAAIYNLCKACCQQLRGKLPAFAAHPFALIPSPGIPPICYTPTFMTFNGHLFQQRRQKRYKQL